ncbi:MAG: hypothetical protein AAFV25_14975 [Bacteroidota bacterium]
MRAACIHLRPFTRFHFGEVRMDNNLALASTSLWAHSDTLFSALVSAYSLYNGSADAFVSAFRSGELQISSFFYFLKKGSRRIYFLPKPHFLSIDADFQESGTHKLQNGIAFVSVGVWERGFQQQRWFEPTDADFKVVNERFVMTREELEALALADEGKVSWSIVRRTTQPKSPQRANTADASIFYQTDVEISAAPATQDDVPIQSGGYFLYRANSPEAEAQLRTATQLVAYSGLGGERHHIGRTPLHEEGQEAVDFVDWSLQSDASSTHFSNLSLFNPQGPEDLQHLLYYRTVLRGGRPLSATHALKVVRMIREGALLTSDQVKGRLVPTGQDELGHETLRHGLPFLLPLSHQLNLTP